MKLRWFGTDGIRGRVGSPPMTPDFCLRLGAAAGCVFGAGSTVLIGKDTRISGYMLESALEAGFVSSGVNVLLLGPMPTPAIAYLTSAFRAQAGVVISASHNSCQDNGIKFFDGAGEKLSNAQLGAIEAGIRSEPGCLSAESLGKARRVDDALGRYIEYCKARMPRGMSLRGLRIVVDAAHGACYLAAPAVMSELGAEVIAIGAAPDGLNINLDCGSVHPHTLAAETRARQADFGMALDGDGDRLIMADSAGRVYDGDALLFLLAASRARQGRLGGGAVHSEMSNLGLSAAFARLGIASKRVPVGDRHIKEALVTLGWTIGGEPSGHILMLDMADSGDGLLSALAVLQSAMREDRTLQALCEGYEPLPNQLRNLPAAAPGQLVQRLQASGIIKAAEQALGDTGRLLVRPSGTEDVVRLLVEGQDERLVGEVADELVRQAEGLAGG